MKLRTALLGAAAAFSLAPAAWAERGADGEVKLTFPQAVSILNPYLTDGTKDLIASSMLIEPLAGYDPTGTIFPRLVTEIPSVENGGISEDLTSVTWKLIPGLLWSDGTAFTAADVVFTGQYCMDPAGGCAQSAKFSTVASIEAVDDLTVKVTFTGPQPNPFTAFVGYQSPILQKAQFEACMGAAAPTCTDQNSGPIGTGPFRVTGFTVNDTVQMEANPNYRDPAKPAFATVLIKGGGDAIGSARAVMETGEFDYAWNTQIPPDAQAQMTAAGKGAFVVAFGSLMERIDTNLTNPSADLPEGERSTAKHPHPILTDANVRKALSMAIDRATLVEVGYGAGGKATCNLVPAPEAFASTRTECLTQDLEGAKALLDAAGWVPGADGIREKDGMRLSFLYQTTVNPIRQDFQALIKSWWTEIGVETELRSVDPGVFFGGDPGSPDTFQRFYADVQMYANNFNGTDPQVYLSEHTCDQAPAPENQWQGPNINRFCDPAYDALMAELVSARDPAKRSEIAIKLNDMLTNDSSVIIPLVHRGTLSAHLNTLGGVAINPWDSEIWNSSDWFRVK
jgi:peptide/nickel transport system substrate-binding protein